MVGYRAHSEAEQAGLRYAEALTRAADTDRDAAFQRFHDALAENFSLEEMLEIVGVVVDMNVWTRSNLPRARCRAPGPRLKDAEEPVRLSPSDAEPCLADEVVCHAFSHGFHPEHSQRLATIGERHSVARPVVRDVWTGPFAKGGS